MAQINPVRDIVLKDKVFLKNKGRRIQHFSLKSGIISNGVNMVDISKKGLTSRLAVASVKIIMNAKTLESIRKNKIPKGDVLAASQVAGILAAKNISAILPLCHQINLSHIKIDFSFGRDYITVFSTVKAKYATGVEMEALLSAAVCALNIYDMCKAVDKRMVITDLKLLKKTGGKSDYHRKNK